MADSIYSSTYNKTKQLINSGRLNESFSLIKNSINKYNIGKKEEDSIYNLENTYKYLLTYMENGLDDPSRLDIIANIKESLLRSNDLLLQTSLLADSSDLYSTIKRIDLHRQLTVQSRLNEFNESILRSDAENYDSSKLSESATIALINLFNSVFTMFGADDSDYEALGNFFINPNIPDYAKANVIAAILLGSIKYFDAKSLKILFDAYETVQSMIIKARIITSITLISVIHSDRLMKNDVLKTRFSILTEDAEAASLLKEAIISIIQVYDTDRVTTKMREEVIPGLMKINPEIIEKMRNLSSDSDDFLSDTNPDWENIIEKSGIQDKLQEINEMQMEGSDVMMTTFSQLKGYPFFNEMSNWFLPFLNNHPALESPQNNEDEPNYPNFTLAMCDSDVYSFLFSLKSLPIDKRTIVLKNMEMQMKQAEEMLTSATGDNSVLQSKRTIKHFLQDLYRFEKLFKRKYEFNDPFSKPILTEDLKFFIDLSLINPSALYYIAEFYFKHNYYGEAVNIYETANSLEGGNSYVWEKIGFCYDKLTQYNKAYDWYKRSELINPDSEWIQKKLAVCLKKCGKYQDAIEYYEKVLEKKPEDYHLLMSAGQCFLNNGNPEKALQFFYHAEYLKPEKKTALRAIAWSQLLSKDFIKASDTYAKLINEDGVERQDYLNAALCRMALKDIPAAIPLFNSFLNATGTRNFRELLLALKEDSETLKILDISSSDLRLVIDALRYKS